MAISDKDIKVYEWIKDYMMRTGFCPSAREIADGVGYKSLCSVKVRMDHLEKYGLLIRKCEASPVYKLAGMKYVMEEVGDERNVNSRND